MALINYSFVLMDQQSDQDLKSIDTWTDLANIISQRYTQTQQITAPLRTHLRNSGYPTPAPIQKMVLPYLLKANSSERFVYIKSPTGTGKTLSFVLPMLVFFEDYYLKNHLQVDEQGNSYYLPYALIMVNSHPLLRQIQEDFMAAIPQESRNSGFYVQHFDKGDNETSIKGQVLCGVPDKICQLVQKNIINLGNVRYIVVDEADNTIMNDKNSLVLRVVKSLITTGNMNWKMIVCGATIEMNQLKSRFHEALLNAPGVKETPNFFDFKYFHYEIVLDNIYHFYVPTAVKSDMERVLIEVITQTLTAFDLSQIMVFFNQKLECQTIYEWLQRQPQLEFLVKKDLICEVRSGMAGEAVLSRSQQQEIIELFRSEKKCLMLCSDLMGRGMNFRQVRLVVNFGVPRASERGNIDMRRYDQRVGRTGRMEDLGVALTIFNPECESCDQPESFLLELCKVDKILVKPYQAEEFKQQFSEVIEKTKLHQTT